MSISREDIDNRHIKTLSISVNHVMRYIDTMGKKDKKTMSDVYPIEMTENNKNTSWVIYNTFMMIYWED